MYDEDDTLPQTLSYFILNKLRWRIISGELKPGQPLREMEIEADYGSSRGPVRESLRLLLQSGLVETQPRRGFRVRDYTPDDVRNIYELRAALEGMVVAALEGRRPDTAVRHASRQTENHGVVLQARGHQRVLSGEQQISSVHHRLHRQQADLPGPVLRQRDFPARSLPSAAGGIAHLPALSRLYHEEITACLESGDIAGARTATEAHILENLERATAFYVSPIALET